MTEEQWKPIPSYNGYEASSFGRIRYVKRWKSPRILKAGKHTRGYSKYTLCVNGRPFTVTGHRMVALAFIPNPLSLPEVNHINAIKTDDRPSNLEWTDRKGNTEHAVKNGLYPTGEKHHNSKLSNSDVLDIKNMLSKGVLPSLIAKQFNVGKCHIKQIRSGRYRAVA